MKKSGKAKSSKKSKPQPKKSRTKKQELSKTSKKTTINLGKTSNVQISSQYDPNNMELINEKDRDKRPPIPEYPAKIFNLYKTKIAVKMYYINPAEELPYDFEPRDDEDSEYEMEKTHKISFKGVKQDIIDKMNIKQTIIDEDKLLNYHIKVLNIFKVPFPTIEYSSVNGWGWYWMYF